MECTKFVWELAFSYIPIHDRIKLRLLSKSHNYLIVRTMNELVVRESRDDDVDCLNQIGPYSNHLFLDGFNSNLSHLLTEIKNVASLTFRNNFTFHNQYGEPIRSSEVLANEIIQMTNKLNLKSIDFGLPKKTKFMIDIINNQDLLNLYFNVMENPGQAYLILGQLGFKNLKSIGIYAARVGNRLNTLLGNKSVNLNKINLHGCIEACEGIYSLPEISSLKELRLNLNGYDFIVQLDNPESLPNLHKIDLNQLPNSFTIGIIKVWPHVTDLRLHLNHFQDIDLHESFPNLKKLSYNLQTTPPENALRLLSSLQDINSLFVNCPEFFELPEIPSFRSLQCLSLKIRYALNPNFIMQLAVCAPNLIELSINSTSDYFEKIFIKTDCHFASLMRFISKNYLSYQFWVKLVNVAPVLVDIHNDDCALNIEDLKEISASINIHPFYEIEDLVFGRFSKFH